MRENENTHSSRKEVGDHAAGIAEAQRYLRHGRRCPASMRMRLDRVGALTHGRRKEVRDHVYPPNKLRRIVPQRFQDSISHTRRENKGTHYDHKNEAW
jgi:hypothetical protein